MKRFWSKLMGRALRPTPQIEPWKLAVLDRLDELMRVEAAARSNDGQELNAAPPVAQHLEAEIKKAIVETRPDPALPVVPVPVLDAVPPTSESRPLPSPAKVGKAPSAKKPRFRRSRQEMAMGLTPEQAQKRRRDFEAMSLDEMVKTLGGKPAARVRTQVEVPAERPLENHDLVSTLREPLRSRTELVLERKRAGLRGIQTTAELDAEIKRRVDAGEVTKLPAFIDSAGYRHAP